MTSSGYSLLSFHEVLDDLEARFIINIPSEELSSVERICFQIEQAHWFYEDFVREENPKLPSHSLKSFTFAFFQHCHLLRDYSKNKDKAFEEFMEYKVRVPVCGGILLKEKSFPGTPGEMDEEEDSVLLVRGWKPGSSYSFPKGKINKNEPEEECALREIKEEIGFDASPYLDPKQYIERTIKEQKIRLYILKGIPAETRFETMTRKEIGDIRWFRMRDLPGLQDESFSLDGNLENGPHKTSDKTKQFKFHLVTVFMPQLKRWMDKHQKLSRKKGGKGRGVALVRGYKTGSESDSESNKETTVPSSLGVPTKHSLTEKKRGRKKVSFRETEASPLSAPLSLPPNTSSIGATTSTLGNTATEATRLALLSALKGPSSSTTTTILPATQRKTTPPKTPTKNIHESSREKKAPKSLVDKPVSTVQPLAILKRPSSSITTTVPAAETKAIKSNTHLNSSKEKPFSTIKAGTSSSTMTRKNPLLTFVLDIDRIMTAFDAA